MQVFDLMVVTKATKEAHCFSWMYAELLSRYVCKGSHGHVAAGGERLRLLEIGYFKGDSMDTWKQIFPGASCLPFLQ